MKLTSFFLCLFLIGAVFLIATPSFAHNDEENENAKTSLSKGNFLLGGDFDASVLFGSHTVAIGGSVDDETKDSFSAGAGCLLGYFVIQGLEIGAIFDVYYTKIEHEKINSTDTVDIQYYIGPQLGYFYPVGNSFSLFGMGAFGYRRSYVESKSKEPNTTVEIYSQGNGQFVEPRVGTVIHVNKYLAFSGTFFFMYSMMDALDDTPGASIDYDIVQMDYGLKIGLLGFIH